MIYHLLYDIIGAENAARISEDGSQFNLASEAKFPDRAYQVYRVIDGEYVNDLDFTPDFADALDTFIKALTDGAAPRVLAMEWDGTALQGAEDVTGEFEVAVMGLN